MRIGFLAPDLNDRHGWGSYSLGLMRALQRAGVQLTIAAASDSPQPADLPLVHLMPSVSPLAGAFLTRQALAQPRLHALLKSCDLIHALVEPYAPAGNWLAGKRPLFITAHGSYARLPAYRNLSGSLYRRGFLRAEVICVSRFTETVVRDILPAASTCVIPNGLDAERYLALPRQPETPPLILAVGAVKARKGIRELVSAMYEVRKALPGARLVIVGSTKSEPEYTAAVSTDIERLGLQDAVRLAGRLEQTALDAFYSAATVFALPSQTVERGFEGFGLALLEASAAGLPVVSTRGSGTEDAIDDGVTGLLVAQDDDRALAEALIRLLTDAALAARMGEAGRAKAAAQTWDHVARRYLDRYEYALRDRPPRLL